MKRKSREPQIREKKRSGQKAPAICRISDARSHPAARRLRAEREDKQVGRMRKLCQERQP